MCLKSMLSVKEINSSNFKMWLIDSRQQQAVEHITVIQAFVLLFKFVMSETKESFAPRTIALLVGILISIGDVHKSIALNVKAKGSHSATL